jgi:hypothetical protein
MAISVGSPGHAIHCPQRARCLRASSCRHVLPGTGSKELVEEKMAAVTKKSDELLADNKELEDYLPTVGLKGSLPPSREYVPSEATHACFTIILPCVNVGGTHDYYGSLDRTDGAAPCYCPKTKLPGGTWSGLEGIRSQRSNPRLFHNHFALCQCGHLIRANVCYRSKCLQGA